MKALILLFAFLFAIARISAQNYQIDFAGSGASTTVDSVKVQNLSQCTRVSLGGNDILNLTAVLSGINESNSSADNTLNIFPNPATNYCYADFNISVQSETTIILYDITGKIILQDQEILSKGHHSFMLTGISGGIYILTIRTDNYYSASKIVSNNEATGIPAIKNIGSGIEISGKEKKRSRSVIDMQFNANDTLKFIGISGNFRTIFMLIPKQSQTVTFNFSDCTDADGNHYAVVQIGSQLWMAENLKATKYRDGTSIPNLADSVLWHNATAGGYCDYHNIPAEGAQYGHLYNWYAIDTSLNIAPVGWHVSSDAEWTTLINFLGGANIAGKKIKENCNTRWAYLDSTWGNNISGFTALCSNYRNGKGATFDWSMAPNNDHDSFFWTTTEYNANSAYVNALRWCYNDIWRCGFVPKSNGACVRCVHD